MASPELLEALDPALRDRVLRFVDWLMRATPGMTDHVAILETICGSLRDLGIPLDRYRASMSVTTADADAFGRTWIRGSGVSDTSYLIAGDDDPAFLRSPFHATSVTGRWVDLWLPATPDDSFGIVPELKADGYTHYICAAWPALVGLKGWLTVATKARQGFGATDKALLAFVLPFIGALISTRVTRFTLNRLLRTYVGEDPQRAILGGKAKRGQVSTIRSAILFADMRDSVGHTAEIDPIEAVKLIDDVFDCLVPPIESRGSEVLKYMGDGLLAIFRETGDGARAAAAGALAAAIDGLDRLSAFNAGGSDHSPVDVGVSLHYGEVAYGNIGSGLRLDFTVIGRDVGLASRIGGMNAILTEPLLMSEAFIDHLDAAVECIGTFPLRGFKDAECLFRPGPRLGS